MEKNNLGNNCWVLGGSHSSVVSSAPTVAAGSNPEHTNYTFSICIIEIVMRKGWKETKKKPGLAHFFKKTTTAEFDNGPIAAMDTNACGKYGPFSTY